MRAAPARIAIAKRRTKIAQAAARDVRRDQRVGEWTKARSSRLLGFSEPRLHLPAKCAGHLARGFPGLFGDASQPLLGELLHRPGQAERGHNIPAAIKHWSGNAAHAASVLLVVDGVAVLA